MQFRGRKQVAAVSGAVVAALAAVIPWLATSAGTATAAITSGIALRALRTRPAPPAMLPCIARPRSPNAAGWPRACGICPSPTG